MPAMSAKTFKPADPAVDPYSQALSLIRHVADDKYRRALTDALINEQVRRVRGCNAPDSELAMRLRREAADI